MLKIENINSNQNKIENFVKQKNSDTNSLNKGTVKDIFTRSTVEEDIRYTFPKTNNSSKLNGLLNTDNTNKTGYLLNTEKDEEKTLYPIAKDEENKLSTVYDDSKNITNLIGPDIENTGYYDDKFTGDLTYQMLKNISKDIEKQIEFLSVYNFTKVTAYVNSMEQSLIM